MIERSKNFTDYFVENYCLKNFDKMMDNQFSSRVLQKILSTRNTKFINFCLKNFRRNFFSFVDNLSSVIFATKLINECSDEKEFYFIEKILKDSNGSVVVKNPNILRILVTIFSNFSDDILKRMFKVLKKYIWNLLNDKFGNYILQRVIEKNMVQYKEMIEEKCLKNTQKVILKKYPRYILLKLIENDSNGLFCEKLFKEMCLNQRPFFVHKKLVWKKETSCLVVLSMFGLRRKIFEECFVSFVEILMKDSDNFEKITNQCNFYFLITF